MLRLTLTALAGVLLAAGARADTFPYRAVVTDPEVKVRCGPTDKFEETGTLPRGTSVIVEREEAGWLAIAAPVGSVSWVQATFVDSDHLDGRFPRNVYVSSDTDVTVAAGRAGLDQPLDRRTVKVPPGTVFTVIGQPAKFDNRTWFPITPPADDVRYLPKSAVQFEKPAATNFTVRTSESVSPLPAAAGSGAPVLTVSSGTPAATLPPAATPAGGAVASVPGPGVTPTAASGPPVASAPLVDHPLWAQAEKAERENRLADAKDLYFRLAQEINVTKGDHAIADLCYTRMHAIRDKQLGARAAAVPVSSGPSALKPPAKEERAVRAGVPEALPPAADAKDDRGEKGEWYTGKLVFSTSTPDGPNRQVYLLEAPGGVVKLYVTAGAGVELNKYVGKQVSVRGTPTTRSTLAKPYLVATDAEPAR